MDDVVSRASALRASAQEAASCERCALAEGRTQVVFGSGDPDADLFLVGEAPGFHEDRSGAPLVGQAGELLDRLLASIGLARADVYLANVLKCRPLRSRDPLPQEIAACAPHLMRQIELVRPRVVASLGNVATKLLAGRELGITRVHGRARELVCGGERLVLYPLYHPAAALYTPAMLRELEQDFARIPTLLGAEEPDAAAAPPRAPAAAEPVEAELVQLGLF